MPQDCGGEECGPRQVAVGPWLTHHDHLWGNVYDDVSSWPPSDFE